MILAFIAIIFGLALLVWSADRFVEGAATTAQHLGMPTLLIGMVIVGFGTSAPELAVSALAAYQGNPGIALGNAYGSNISNIALIIGATALISPLLVHGQILRKELPILVFVTCMAALQALDGELTRGESWTLLGTFAILMSWNIWKGFQHRNDTMKNGDDSTVIANKMSLGVALLWLLIGLLMLILSSRMLVWGAVEIAHSFGISDLVIGLTIVALGTSLPELASSAAASRKGEHDIALGNVVGSNLFNTLAAVGMAGVIHPMTVGPEVLSRDIFVMGILTLSLFILGYGGRGMGRINRFEGSLLLACYLGYTGYLLTNALSA
ncbi:MAG: calcium/sodium antiporter [Desulfobacteraceae bacterium]|jgi:cation:H+ antiporter